MEGKKKGRKKGRTQRIGPPDVVIHGFLISWKEFNGNFSGCFPRLPRACPAPFLYSTNTGSTINIACRRIWAIFPIVADFLECKHPFKQVCDTKWGVCISSFQPGWTTEYRIMACMSAATQFFHALTSGFTFLAFYFLLFIYWGRSHWLLMFVTDNFLRRFVVGWTSKSIRSVTKRRGRQGSSTCAYRIRKCRRFKKLSCHTF